MSATTPGLSAHARRGAPGLGLAGVLGLVVLTAAVPRAAYSQARPLSPAQIQDSILILLTSREIAKRSEGVEWSREVPVERLSPAVRARLVAMVNSEEAEADSAKRAGGRHGEGRGEYQIALIEAGLRLDDPATIPGMACLGVQVTGEARRFLLRQGRAAVPHLTAAFRGSDGARVPALKTLVGFLRDSASTTAEDRVGIRAIMLRATAFELSLTASPADFPELIGAFAWAADSAAYDFERIDAARHLARWRAAAEGIGAADLLGRTLPFLGAACMPEQAAACERLVEAGAAVRSSLTGNWGPQEVRDLDGLVSRMASDCRSGAIVTGGCQLLSATFHAVREKLH